jgi:hypothetical protein
VHRSPFRTTPRRLPHSFPPPTEEIPNAASDRSIGLALSGQDPHLPELRGTVAALLERGLLDYLDLVVRSLDTRAEVGRHTGHVLLDLFTDLPRGKTRVGVSGDVMSAAGARRALDQP